MPNLLGAVDGKRILLQQPDNSGSHYHDYKGIFFLTKYFVTNKQISLFYYNMGMCSCRCTEGVTDAICEYEQKKGNLFVLQNKNNSKG